MEELLSAINKDAKESSLETLLGGTRSFTHPNGWCEHYIWLGKLDTGSDIPDFVEVEVAKYNGTLLVIGVYDPATRSTKPLPWHGKVEADHNYWG